MRVVDLLRPLAVRGETSRSMVATKLRSRTVHVCTYIGLDHVSSVRSSVGIQESCWIPPPLGNTSPAPARPPRRRERGRKSQLIVSPTACRRLCERVPGNIMRGASWLWAGKREHEKKLVYARATMHSVCKTAFRRGERTGIRSPSLRA